MEPECHSQKILILDGEQRSTLAVVRSLGRRGFRVFVGSEHDRSLAACSKFCEQKMRYRNPFDYPEEFCDDLLDFIEDKKIHWLLPTTDLSMNAVLDSWRRFDQRVKIPCESKEKYLKASDKIYLAKLAMQLGIRVPSSQFFSHKDELLTCLTNVNYPAVLKPACSIVHSNGKMIKTGVKMVGDEGQLLEVVDSDPAFAHPFLLQERVSGQGEGIFALCQNGNPLAIFSHRRLREKPPWGGVSVLCESAEPNPDAKDHAIKLLSALNWNGVAMVEFKHDPETDTHYLMEINARFWGSLQLAIDAGVDFPFLLLQIYQGVETYPIDSYNYARLRWLLGDLDSCYLALKPSSQSMMPVRRSRVLANFFKEFFKGSKFQNLRPNDPNPFLYEFILYLKQLL